MSDKIQVVRVDDDLLFVDVDGVGVSMNDGGIVRRIGDVIELTKESRAIFGDGHGDRYRSRLVSEWEAGDG